RLLDYVSNGGTLVVQYNRDFVWDKLQPAPYPALISPPLPPAKEGAPPTPRQLPRITDENSPVKFLKPNDPLLNTPNKITPEDFKGWVQERGLYFWTQFDPKYTALLAMHDPGEPDLDGGLVYAHYGKGTYIYTGLAFNPASRTSTAGWFTHTTAKARTFTPDWRSSGNCPTECPARIGCLSTCSALRERISRSNQPNTSPPCAARL